MQITKEMVEQRLAVLKQEQQQAVAQVNMYVGAIKDAEWLLETLNKEEAPVDEKVSEDAHQD